jgi:hypothetical protein
LPYILDHLTYIDIISLLYACPILLKKVDKILNDKFFLLNPKIIYKKKSFKNDIPNNLFIELNLIYPINNNLYEKYDLLRNMKSNDIKKKFFDSYFFIKDELNKMNLIKININKILLKNSNKLINKIIYIDANKYRKLYISYKNMLLYKKILAENNNFYNFDLKNIFFPPYSIEFDSTLLFDFVK